MLRPSDKDDFRSAFLAGASATGNDLEAEFETWWDNQ